MGGVATTVRVCAAGTEILGCDDPVRAQQRRSAADTVPGPARDHGRRAANFNRRRTNRARDHRWRPVSGENGCGAAERVRIAGARARKHRTLRDYGVFRESAKTRDWVAHGIGRGPGKRTSADSETRYVAGVDRRPDWLRGVADRRTLAEQDAVRRERERSDQYSGRGIGVRSEEHTSELQSLRHLVCRLLLEK